MAADDRDADAPDPKVEDDVEAVDLSDEESDDIVAERAPAGHRVSWSWAITAGIVGLVLLVAATIGGGWATREHASAATVNGHDITTDDLKRELSAFVNNKTLRDDPQARAQIFTSGGGIASSFTASRLEELIFTQFVHDEVVRRRLTVDPKAIADQVATYKQNPQNAGYPAWYLETAARRAVEQRVLGAALSPQEQQAFLTAQLRKGNITVDPRYGTLDRTGRNIIIPPAAPAVPSERNGGTTPTTVNPLGG